MRNWTAPWHCVAAKTSHSSLEKRVQIIMSDIGIHCPLAIEEQFGDRRKMGLALHDVSKDISNTPIDPAPPG